MGLICGSGNTKEEVWSNLLAGRSAVGPVSHFDASAFPVRIASEVKNFDPFKFIEKREVKKMDVRRGGKWQYLTRTSGGEVVDFHGTYREVVAPEKLVYSFLFGDMPEGDGFVEITLVEKDGVTELRDRGVFSSKES